MTRKYDRIIVVAINGLGLGSAPDALHYGKQGADSLGRLNSHFRARLQLPNLRRLGLGKLHPLFGSVGSSAKGTAVGQVFPTAIGESILESYWELAGVPTREELTAFPAGFPRGIVEKIVVMAKRPVLVNQPYAPRRLLLDWGADQVATGGLLLTTSGGSDLLLTAHEDSVPITELVRIGKDVRRLFDEDERYQLGQVTVVPFAGTRPGDFYYRWTARKDLSMTTPGVLLAEKLTTAEIKVSCLDNLVELVAKVGMNATPGLYLTNVQAVSRAGQDRDPEKMGQLLMAVDGELGRLVPLIREDDLLLVTAAHGADPDFPGSGVTREWLPLLAYSPGLVADELTGIDKLADVADLVMKNFELKK